MPNGGIMKTSLKIVAASALATSFLASAAVAATVKEYTFEFDQSLGNNNASVNVKSNEDANVGVTVTGFNYSIVADMYTPGAPIDVDSNAWGLISKNCGASGCEQHTLDSWGPDESFKFVLDGGLEAKLVEVDISWSTTKLYKKGHNGSYSYVSGSYRAGGTDAYADYDLFADGKFLGNTRDGDPLPTDAANEFAIGTSTYYYSMFVPCGRSGAPDDCTKEKYYMAQYGIKIERLKFEYEDDPAVIPLPAAGWLLLGGIGGLAALRRRKRS